MSWQNPNDEDTVTRRQLRDELAQHMTHASPPEFASYYSLTELVNETVNEILRKRSTLPPKVDVTGGKAAITLDELDAALNRMNYNVGLHADRIYRNIVDHREPVWKDGDVVKDAGGHFFRRSGNAWTSFGTSRAYEDNYPIRPLKKI